MLIISQEQFLEELKQDKSKSILIGESNSKTIDVESKTEASYLDPIVPDEVVLENHTYDNFRKNAVPNTPKELKPIIGALAKLDTIENVANAFNVSKDTVGNLANDKHTNAIASEVKVNILERVKSNTVEKIDQCVQFIEVLKGMPNKELLATAESLSRINKNITPVAAPTEGDKVQFIFYAPASQDVIDVNNIIDAVN